MMARIRNITLLAMVALAVAAPAALAANYHDAIRDCNDDGVLEGRYSAQTLRQARAHLPASLREYSDCADVLARALAAAAKNGGTGGGDPAPTTGDPALSTPSGALASRPEDLKALERQTSGSTSNHAGTVSVGNRNVTPGTAGLLAAASHNSPNTVPGSLLAALIALGALAALAVGLVMRHRWPETRRVALRLLRR